MCRLLDIEISVYYRFYWKGFRQLNWGHSSVYTRAIENRLPVKSLVSRLLYDACYLTLALTVVLSANGCAHYRVTVPDSDPLGDYEGDKMHAFFWGLYNKPEVLAAECEGEGIDNARIQSNFLYNLAGVVTLGIWMPIEVRYQCKAPPADAGEFPDDDVDRTLETQ